MTEGNEAIDTNHDGGGDNPNNGQAKDKVEFTPEQQDKVQQLINDAYKKSGRKSEQEMSDIRESSAKELDAVHKELALLRNKKQTSTEGTEESKKVIDGLVARLEEKDKAFEVQNESIRSEKKTNSLYSAIGKQDVIDPQDVVSLLKDRVGINDSGDVFIKGEGGSPKLNQHGEEQNVEEFVAEWLRDRPHFLKGSSGGAGSMGGHGSNGSVKYDLTDPEVWRNLPKEEFDRLMSEGVTVGQAKGAALKFKKTENKFLKARRENNK